MAKKGENATVEKVEEDNWIGMRIAERRKALTMSQETLAKELGWGQATISQYESSPFKKDKKTGDFLRDESGTRVRNKRFRKLDADRVEALSGALACSIQWLLTGRETPFESALPSYDILYISQKIMELSPRKREGLSLILDIDLQVAREQITRTKLPGVRSKSGGKEKSDGKQGEGKS